MVDPHKQDAPTPLQVKERHPHLNTKPDNMTEAEWEKLNSPKQDVLSFLQGIGQRLKNAQTANQPTTVTKITEEIDAYVSHLGSGRVKGYGVEHRDGKERAVVL